MQKALNGPPWGGVGGRLDPVRAIMPATTRAVYVARLSKIGAA